MVLLNKSPNPYGQQQFISYFFAVYRCGFFAEDEFLTIFTSNFGQYFHSMKKLYLFLVFCCLSASAFALSTLGNFVGGNVAAATFCAPKQQTVFEFTVRQSGASTTMSNVRFTTTGSTYAMTTDVTNFQLWANTTQNFATATAVGAAITVGIGPGVLNYPIAGGYNLTNAGGPGTTYYFWITANVVNTAVTGRTIAVTTAGPGAFGITVAAGGTAGAVASGGTQTINNVPTAVTATATPNPVCLNSNLTLTSTATNATSYSWAGPSAYISALQNPTPFAVSATSAGIYTVTATNACGSTTASTSSVTINALPAAISGATPICLGTSVNFTDASGAGTWSSSVPGTASVTSPGGVVTGLALGTTTITFTLTSTGCTAIYPTTVSTSLPAITGLTSLCQLTTTTLGDSYSGGTWTTSGTTVASIDATTGALTGLTAGTDTVTYTGAGCTATTVITVNPIPNPGGITGTGEICLGSTSTLADTPAGGVWVSGDPLIATVDPVTGIVTGVGAGLAEITYNLTNACGTTGATYLMTIDRAASAITGSGIVCVGNTIALADSALGGTWSASNGNATVNSVGQVTGVAVGTTVISYNVTNACGSSLATFNVTIGLGAATGMIIAPTDICIGSSDSLIETVTGGQWSVSNTTNAIISPTGILTGLAHGIDSVIYSETAACGTTFAYWIINVDSFGAPFVAIAANPGDTSCATLPVTYTAVPTWGGSAPTYLWKVNGTLVSTSNAYTYTPANHDTVYCLMTSNYACAILPTGSNFLITTVLPKLIPTVSIIAGTLGDTICVSTLDTFFASTTNAGTAPAYRWSVNSVAVGTGSSLVYTPTNSDTISCVLVSNAQCAIPDSVTGKLVMTVNTTELPEVSIDINPSDTVCSGTLVTYTAKYLYGGRHPSFVWLKNGVPVATGPSYTYNPSNYDNILCQMTSNSPCAVPFTVNSSTVVMHTVPVVTPVVTVTSSGGALVPYGHNDTLVAALTSGGGPAPTYQWVVNGTLVYGATSNVYVLNYVTGTNNVTCIVTGSGNCPAAEAMPTITVGIIPSEVHSVAQHINELAIAPNPNKGTFNVIGTTQNNEVVRYEVTDILGRKVFEGAFTPVSGSFNVQINLPGNLNGGIYLFKSLGNGVGDVVRMTLER